MPNDTNETVRYFRDKEGRVSEYSHLSEESMKTVLGSDLGLTELSREDYDAAIAEANEPAATA